MFLNFEKKTLYGEKFDFEVYNNNNNNNDNGQLVFQNKILSTRQFLDVSSLQIGTYFLNTQPSKNNMRLQTKLIISR